MIAHTYLQILPKHTPRERSRNPLDIKSTHYHCTMPKHKSSIIDFGKKVCISRDFKARVVFVVLHHGSIDKGTLVNKVMVVFVGIFAITWCSIENLTMVCIIDDLGVSINDC